MTDLRLSIDSTFDKTLKSLIQSNPDAKNEADIVQRAVATYQYLRDRLDKGDKIQLVDRNSQVIESDLRVP